MDLADALAAFEDVALAVAGRHGLDVAAGAEVPTRAGEHDGLHGRVVAHFGHGFGEGGTQFQVQCIALVRAVHRQQRGGADAFEQEDGHGNSLSQ